MIIGVISAAIFMWSFYDICRNYYSAKSLHFYVVQSLPCWGGSSSDGESWIGSLETDGGAEARPMSKSLLDENATTCAQADRPVQLAIMILPSVISIY